MLIKTLLNNCYKFSSFVYTNIKLEIDEYGSQCIIIDILPRKNGRKLCNECKRVCKGYDTLKSRLFQFIPLWGIPLFFRYARRRVDCLQHGIIVEFIPWAEGKSHLTTAFKIYLSQWAKYLSWSTVAAIFGLSWYHVFCSVKYVVEYGLKNRCLNNIKAIGIDEIQYRIGHVYLTLVYQIDSYCRRLLFISKKRTTKSLLQFFHFFGEARSLALEVACTDMWKSYLKVIAKKAPNAINPTTTLKNSSIDFIQFVQIGLKP